MFARFGLEWIDTHELCVYTDSVESLGQGSATSVLLSRALTAVPAVRLGAFSPEVLFARSWQRLRC